MTTLVNLHRDLMEISIQRPSKWGNPFFIGKHGDRAEVIERYAHRLIASDLMNDLPEIRGKVLGCTCAPLACHGDILVALADEKSIFNMDLPMMGPWYRITTEWACFAVEVDDGYVVRAAPIAKWSIGREWEHVKNYYESRGAEIVKLDVPVV